MPLPDEAATLALGAEIASCLEPGILVALVGPLGAGKTTLVRGMLAALGYAGPVTSPTFDLIHVYPGDPPVAHVDLYRLPSAEGIGLEDFLYDHVCLVEWADRDESILRLARLVVELERSGEGRRARILERHGIDSGP